MITSDNGNLRYIDPTEPGLSEAPLAARERDVLDAINQRIAGAESLEEIMDFLFASTRDICPCDRIGLAFLEDEGVRITAHWARALYEPLVLAKGYSEELRRGSLKALLEQGTVRIINDLETYLADHPDSASTKLLVREGVRSSMTCPLRVDGRIVGVMFRSSRQAKTYNEHQVRMHLDVAERLSQAVEKAYRIEQLAAANKAYFEMLGFVSHELKNPLASIMTDGYALTEDYFGPMAPEHHAVVERMIRKAQFVLDLARDYLNLAQIEGGQLEASPEKNVDLVKTVLEPAVEVIEPALQEKEMRLERDIAENLPPVECDPRLLKIVAVNLLGNAVKYGKHGGLVQLAVSRSDTALKVSVRNEGPGFPPSERSKLFRKFSRLTTPELLKEKGTGVGLYTCWRIIRLHHGMIDARSEPGQWAEFWFEIPQPLAPSGDTLIQEGAS